MKVLLMGEENEPLLMTVRCPGDGKEKIERPFPKSLTLDQLKVKKFCIIKKFQNKTEVYSKNSKHL